MNKYVLLTLFLIHINFYSLAQNELEFVEEDITFEITDSIFKVKGIYYFHSSTESYYPISFPFPVESIYSKPFNISVKNLSSKNNINYEINKDTSSIFFRPMIKGTTSLLISYSQELYSNIAKYVLLSTNAWDKPLEKANYKLVVEPNLKIEVFSYKPDNTIEVDNKKIYLWNKVNFRPRKDFKIVIDK
jgi:hypothetical protein